jgi:hypothetical protein
MKSGVSILIALTPLFIPFFLHVLLPTVKIDWSFSPRAIVYSNRVAPIFLAPFANPETWSIAVSTGIQCCLLLCITPHDFGVLWIGWIGLALVRAVTGYFLSRSVGWAYPALFSHWALYESASGIGPVLIAHFVLRDTSIVSSNPKLVDHYVSHPYYIPILTGILCWLECRP